LVIVHLGGHDLVETLLLGNCPAHTQSRMTVMMIGAPQPHQFRRDRIDRIQAHHACLPFNQRSPKSGIAMSAGADTRPAGCTHWPAR
jgi:hypothetical protein